ncbi:mitochondrial distribution and morphology proteins-domain-containing protein [Blastocladiella britannica]|nr:mitochondrial distribution and morphology proteins-domain-containing protein [Blastocladiella britannica]
MAPPPPPPAPRIPWLPLAAALSSVSFTLSTTVMSASVSRLLTLIPPVLRPLRLLSTVSTVSMTPKAPLMFGGLPWVRRLLPLAPVPMPLARRSFHTTATSTARTTMRSAVRPPPPPHPVAPRRPLIPPLHSRLMSTTVPPSPPSLRSFMRVLRWRLRYLVRRNTHRPWTLDELLAAASWLFVGNALFILAGTTTAVSLALLVASSVNMDAAVAYAVGWYLTRATGATVIVGDAIVPNWRQGRIELRNVSVRRMYALDESMLDNHDYYGREDDVDEEEDDMSPYRGARSASGSLSLVTTQPSPLQRPLTRDENNFTKFDIKLASVSVTLDLVRWLDGNGIVKSMIVRGVRGIIDRRDVFWDDAALDAPPPVIRGHRAGDFEMDDVTIDDLCLTVYNPNFRPYSVSVFQAELPKLRKQWLFYDILGAVGLTGMFDNCLFSVHAPQIGSDVESDPRGLTRRVSRLKIDGVPIDHLNYGTRGPFGWITHGTVDVTALIRIPRARRPQDVDELLATLMTELRASALDRLSEATDGAIDGDGHVDLARLPAKVQQVLKDVPVPVLRGMLARARDHQACVTADAPATVPAPAAAVTTPPLDPSLAAAPTLADLARSATEPVLEMDLDLRFNNFRAAAPLLPDDESLTYMQHAAMARPLVAYLNAQRRTAVLLRAGVAIPVSQFDGCWTMYQAGVPDAIAAAVGRAMWAAFVDDADRARRLRSKVGLWGVRTAAEQVASVWQYVAGRRGWTDWVQDTLRAKVAATVQSPVWNGGEEVVLAI